MEKLGNKNEGENIATQLLENVKYILGNIPEGENKKDYLLEKLTEDYGKELAEMIVSSLPGEMMVEKNEEKEEVTEIKKETDKPLTENKDESPENKKINQLKYEIENLEESKKSMEGAYDEMFEKRLKNYVPEHEDVVKAWSLVYTIPFTDGTIEPFYFYEKNNGEIDIYHYTSNGPNAKIRKYQENSITKDQLYEIEREIEKNFTSKPKPPSRYDIPYTKEQKIDAFNKDREEEIGKIDNYIKELEKEIEKLKKELENKPKN